MLQSIAEGKVFIVAMRQNTVRGSWKNPEQGKKVGDYT